MKTIRDIFLASLDDAIEHHKNACDPALANPARIREYESAIRAFRLAKDLYERARREVRMNASVPPEKKR